MSSHPTIRAGAAAFIAGAVLAACSAGPGTQEPNEQTPPDAAAVDQVTEVEPTWTREIAEAGGPLVWTSHGDRAYLAAWPGTDGEEVELVALDLTTGDDLWAVRHPASVLDLMADERGGVIVVDTIGDASTLTAYDEQGQQRWTTEVDPVPDEVSSGFLHDPVGAFDLENDLVIIGSRAVPGLIGLDLNDGGLRWHLRHENDAGTPLYAGTQLDRFGDAVVAIDDFNAPSIAVLDLDPDGQEPTVRWHRDPGTGFGDGIIADQHGIVAVTASYVRAWDLADGERVAHHLMDWHGQGPGAGGGQGRVFEGVYLFEDSIVIESDRRWVLDRPDVWEPVSYDLDGDDAVPLRKPGGQSVGAYGAPAGEGLFAVGPEGAIARVDAQGQVHAVRADAVDADSSYVPRLLAGESSVAVAVKRSGEPVWDLWAIERSQVGEAGTAG